MPASLSCPSGELHVWQISLAGDDASVHVGFETLSNAERERAMRFAFPHLRRRWVIAHVALRQILASYLACPPWRVQFRSQKHGKPYLHLARGSQPLHFNLTHSEDLALVGVTRIAPLGIDVEHIRPVPDALELAAQFFCREELRDLQACAPRELPVAFFRCWTRKEAFLKAQGKGLSIPLNHVCVSFMTGAPARFLWIQGEPSAVSNWQLHNLSLQEGYVGALAMRSAGACALQIRTYEATGDAFLK
jgi:4'-phosphopantetheinyl transferase